MVGPRGGDTMYIDSHTHFDIILEHGQFSAESLIEQMHRQNVTTAVQIGTDTKSSQWSRDFVKDKAGLFFSAGLHPEYEFSPEHIPQLLETLTICAGDLKCVAIGEVGLDYHYEGYDRKSQIQLLEIQAGFACTHGLPLIIHSRDAMEDTLSVLDAFHPPLVLFHCFGGTKDDARRIIERGWFISFAGNLTFKKAVDLHEAASYIPEERILFETDAPYLAPVPLRGKTNVPANVTHTYAFAAQLRNTDVSALAAAVTGNFSAIFPRSRA